MPEIVNWNEIQENFKDGTLILGNGASMAVHQPFGYASLRLAAQESGHITQSVADVFTAFGTDDFELVLRRLWQAKLVNQSLQVEAGKVEKAYQQVRGALIATVRDIHISHDASSAHFEAIYKFMQSFQTVLSLNYDLVAYWAMLAGNQVLGRWFKDGFQLGGAFREDWQELREPYGAEGATLMFYPHGNLITARKNNYTERKLSTGGGSSAALLDHILEEWEGGEVVPLFVSEGTSDHKKRAIGSSEYLTKIFWEVIPSIEGALVIYGWSISDQDDHILEQIKMAQPQLSRIAVSVYGENQEDANRMQSKLEAAGFNEPVFFDSSSSGCWIHP